MADSVAIENIINLQQQIEQSSSEVTVETTTTTTTTTTTNTTNTTNTSVAEKKKKKSSKKSKKSKQDSTAKQVLSPASFEHLSIPITERINKIKTAQAWNNWDHRKLISYLFRINLKAYLTIWWDTSRVILPYGTLNKLFSTTIFNNIH